MAKVITTTVKIVAEESTTGFKSTFPASGTAGQGRNGNSLAQSEGVLILDSGVAETIPLGDITTPSALGFRRLSGDGEVQIGLQVGALFVPFSGLYAQEAGAVPLPTSLEGNVLKAKHLGGGVAVLEFWVG